MANGLFMANIKPNRKKFRLLVILASLLSIILGLALIDMVLNRQGLLLNWWPHFSLDEVLQFIRSSGSWGVIVIHSFIPFPAELVAIANGMIYGSFWGIVITWSGAMMGACVAFALARKLGRPFVIKFLNQHQQDKLDVWIILLVIGLLSWLKIHHWLHRHSREEESGNSPDEDAD